MDAAGLRDTDDFLEKEGQESLLGQHGKGHALWVVNPHADIQPCPVSNPVALVRTHQDLGEGQEIEFNGPILKTGSMDQGEEIRNFIESHLPTPCDPPIIFTQRQFNLFS